MTTEPAAHAGQTLVVTNGSTDIVGRAARDIADLDRPFELICEDTGERLRITAPWACSIEIID
ncbi:MAG: hypothetical protein BroJett013_30420 [Alphaproteobacteria bacterium]|nr:MAG: hypothetical protein BroJett013_30420 [Alphaproteobacteria bacterium]